MAAGDVVTTPSVTQPAPDMTAEAHTGGMVALVPAAEYAVKLAIAGGLPAGELYLTLCYLGDDVTGWPLQVVAAVQQAALELTDPNAATREASEGDDQDSGAADEELAEATAGLTGPLTLNVFAWSQFNPTGGPAGQEPCLVYQFSGDGDYSQVATLAEAVQEEMKEAIGEAFYPQQHCRFEPHVTAGYGLAPTALSYTGLVVFDRLRVALGDQITDLPLGGDGSMVAAAPIEVVGDTGAEIKVRFPVLALEGMDTGDGRFIDRNGLSHRALPISLLAQPYSSHGGQDAPPAEVFGNITTLASHDGPDVVSPRTGKPYGPDVRVWSGEGVIDGTHPFAKLVRQKFLRGISVDLADLDAELVDEETAAMSDHPRRQAIVHTAEIAAATMVPVPAFADAYVELVGEDPGPALAASALPAGMLKQPIPMWRSPEVGDVVTAAVSVKQRSSAKKAGDRFPGTDKFPITTRDEASKAVGLAGNSDIPSEKVRKWLMGQLKKKGWADLIPDTWNTDGTLKGSSMAASAAAGTPPIDWFRDPGLDQPTIPPVVTDDGRIYGHVAAWDSNHIGFVGRRISPPRSRTDYSHFHVGAARVTNDDGQTMMIPAGHIALDTGHAGLDADYRAATAHYDNTGSLVADVCAGEDQHGIWIAGAVLPGIDDLKLHKLRSCGLSGDWRRIGAGLELVAAISVPTPGFPVPRARVASGVPMSMVAAGALVPDATRSVGAMVDYDQLADVIADRILTRQQRVAALSAQRSLLLAELDDSSTRMAELLAEFSDDDDTSDVVVFANWVQKVGGLPDYIKRIAKHLQEKGKDQSTAIAMAVNVVKKACATGDLNFPGIQHENLGSQAEACAAVAEWEKKKAQSHAS